MAAEGLGGALASVLTYAPPWWLPGGHLQTIWSATCARSTRRLRPQWRRERWPTPDGDFVDVDHLAGDFGDAGEAGARPLLVLFHGLEGSSQSHYARAFAEAAAERGWDFAVPHFRGCSGENNLAPRAYHSGDFEEIHWLLQRFAAAPQRPRLYAVGVSLGGNALMRWTGESGADASLLVDGVAAICAPLDLAAGGQAIDRGFNRQVYARMFLRTMVPKALSKLEQFPGLFDAARLRGVRDLHGFDDVFTAPLHGFRDADDYWCRASAKPLLGQVRVPALVVNARNDPFVPAASLPGAAQVSSAVQLWQPQHGGHVGFAQGRWPGNVRALPDQVLDWLARV
ncbi:hypothetical protein SDC9_86737 [bioreactor metagenome]|uniref:AB hydrolase-1 domain-containing protein n=1 Tax=bioreactor metagenome TaxID=1076179 RepID=A0A644ZH22_9ZZZZ